MGSRGRTNATDLCYTPATELTRLIRTKALSPVELMETVLARIERVNPIINAYCTLTASEAMDAARHAEAMVMAGGPLGDLHGIPVSIEDLAFTSYDLLLTPTISVAAFPVERLNPEHRWDWSPWASFRYPFTFTQQLAATVPAGLTPSGLPVGLRIVGRRFADLTVLQASAAFEAARPWQVRRPPLD